MVHHTVEAMCRLLAACVNERYLPLDVERAMWLLLLQLEGERQGCL